MAANKKKAKKSKAEDAKEGRRDFLRAIVLCLLVVGIVRSFVVEPFKIPSSSMVPTLFIGDHIFVSKFNYGLSLPFSKIQLVEWGGPKRGETIVFLFPRDESLHYIKRVVGIPGDSVEFKGKALYINGIEIPQQPVTDAAELKGLFDVADVGGDIYRETIDGISHYVRYSKKGTAQLSRFGQKVIVPKDSYFVAGDNRDESYDSRQWGVVPRANIKGKAQMIWLSLDERGSFGSLEMIRWSRSGMRIR